MELKKISLGKIQLDNNVFLAPMAGYTDCAFRSEIIKLGAGLTFTELVSARGLFFGGDGSKVLLKTEDYSKTAAQIFGADEYYMRAACEGEELAPFSIVDINMGCPVPKVFKNGEGSALLKTPEKAEKIIKECIKSGKIITVKIRTGITHGEDFAAEFAKMCEGAGASLITVHGRVREDFYLGEPDFSAIARAKNAVKIPIIANGGIFNEKDADEMLEKTGADGVMIARGALKNPFIFSDITRVKSDGDLKAFILRHLRGTETFYKGKRAALEFRKFAPYYVSGRPNAKEFKNLVMSTESTDEIAEAIEKYFN